MTTEDKYMDEFDRENQVDTHGKILLENLTIITGEKSTGAPYQAVSPERFHLAIKFLAETTNIDFSTYTFIDLGCGKGRALLLASQYNFQAVLGVEYAQELSEVARNNLKSAKVTKAFIWEGDAGDFTFPRNNLVIFMYCPFYGPVMQRVIDNLRKSHEYGDFYILYMRPLLKKLFEEVDYMESLGGPEDVEGIEIWTNRNGQ